MHRHAQRRGSARGGDLDVLEMRQQRRAAVPGRVLARIDDVVAAQRRQRDARDRLDAAEALGERAVFDVDEVVDLLRVADEVELVDREHDVPDADERDEIAVPARLREHALARVDEDDREICRRRARDHVARVLLVARRVRDDELAFLGREEAVGDVDRDALLLLGRQPVDEQREIEFVALRADALRVGLERRELVVEQRLRLVQQAADERALAVVDAAAGDEAQQRLVLVRDEIALDVVRDQRTIVGQAGCVHGRESLGSSFPRRRESSDFAFS